jgi:hypothetical protein
VWLTQGAFSLQVKGHIHDRLDLFFGKIEVAD